MTRATSLAVGRSTAPVTQDRWGRLFAALTFSTAHLGNSCALAWYASRPELRRAVTASRSTGSRGAGATRAGGQGTAARCTSPTEGSRE